MPFTTSGIEAATGGAKDILSLKKSMQEDQVRPRELEAATSLAESRATEARSQIDMMGRLSQADAEAAKAIQDANAVGDQGKTLAAMLKAHGEAGNLERTIAIQDKIKKNELDGYEAVSKASKANEASNETMATSIRSIPDYSASDVFVQTQLETLKANPTPENRAKAANVMAVANRIKEYQTKGLPFSQVKHDFLDGVADSMSTSAQNYKLNKIEAENQRAVLKANADLERARIMAVSKEQEIAARRDAQTVGKQTKHTMEAMKIEQAYTRQEMKIQSELDKILTEQGEEVDNPEASMWVSGDSKIPNPLVAQKKAQLEALRVRYDENLLGLQEAIDKGKTFVPKPFDKGLVAPAEKPATTQTKEAPPTRPANVPAGSQYSPSTKTWWKDGKKVG